MSGNAFVLRMNPGGVNRLPVGRQTGEISIGWGKCGATLLNPALPRWDFALHVHRPYNAKDANRIASGISAGQLWRFIRVMSAGDLVVVPDGERLHVAEVIGEPRYDADNEHWAYRRKVKWLTPTAGRTRSDAGPELRSALRTQLTCIDVSPTRQQVAELGGD